MPERKRIRRISTIPKGFLYQPDFITEPEEQRLLAEFRGLPFEQATYHEYLARRRIVEFGLEYSFETNQTTPAAPMPGFLMELRARITDLLPNATPDGFVEAVVTEYTPGCAMGWHRDAQQFGTVFGISLGGPCRMRLRLATADEYQITSLELAPRSAYVMQDEARWRWQHSIPAVTELRYSITFRTLRSGRRASLERVGPEC